MGTAIVELVETQPYWRETYGVTQQSRYVYLVTGPGVHNRHTPHRVTVWDNTRRPNPTPGEWQWTDHGRRGGPGQWLDPHHQGTDDTHSYLLSGEATAITNNGTNTGTEASGQVYAPAPLQIGQYVILRYPEGDLSDPYVVTARPVSNPVLVPVA